MSEQLINHPHEAMEYYQNNKAALGRSIESGLLELLQEESEKGESMAQITKSGKKSSSSSLPSR